MIMKTKKGEEILVDDDFNFPNRGWYISNCGYAISDTPKRNLERKQQNISTLCKRRLIVENNC